MPRGSPPCPTQWAFAEEAAAKHGSVVDRRNWRVLMSWHIAETREQAREEAVLGLQKWHNEYNVRVLGRPGAERVEDPWELLDQLAGERRPGAGAAVVGTPDDLIAAIRNLQEVTGGFGVVLGFVHDWANIEATRRSWDLVARYVIPEMQRRAASAAGVGRLRRGQQGGPDGRRVARRDGQDHAGRRGAARRWA